MVPFREKFLYLKRESAQSQDRAIKLRNTN